MKFKINGKDFNRISDVFKNLKMSSFSKCFIRVEKNVLTVYVQDIIYNMNMSVPVEGNKDGLIIVDKFFWNISAGVSDVLEVEAGDDLKVKRGKYNWKFVIENLSGEESVEAADLTGDVVKLGSNDIYKIIRIGELVNSSENAFNQIQIKQGHIYATNRLEAIKCEIDTDASFILDGQIAPILKMSDVGVDVYIEKDFVIYDIGGVVIKQRTLVSGVEIDVIESLCSADGVTGTVKLNRAEIQDILSVIVMGGDGSIKLFADRKVIEYRRTDLLHKSMADLDNIECADVDTINIRKDYLDKILNISDNPDIVFNIKGGVALIEDAGFKYALSLFEEV